ncbi:hypothetical protein Tco_1375773 [Tanacetum coccineum]
MVDHIVPLGYFSKLRHLPNTEFLAQYNINLARQVALGSQLRLRFEQEVRVLKKARAQVARRNERIQVKEEEIKRLGEEVESLKVVETEVHGLRNQTKNLETLLEAGVAMKKATEAKNAELANELESLCAKFSDLQLNNNQLSQQVSALQAQVEKRCAEMDARLDALSIDFDEELYPRMLTAIAGRRWVIGHGLRLAVMKCAESVELRRAFTNVMSAGIAKGMSGGLEYGVKHVIEAYDPEAVNRYIAALHSLKDLKYSLIDQLEKLKDAPLDLIMASLHLESDPDKMLHNGSVSFAPALPSSQYLYTRRSDGVHVSVPTIAPQGLAILLVDAATQTDISEYEASSRLLRSKSLPPIKNRHSPSLIGPIPKKECHVVERIAQVKMKIALVSLTELTHHVTSKNDLLAVLRCPQFDQTATIEAQMIEEMIG